MAGFGAMFRKKNPEGRSSFFIARAVIVLHGTEMSSQNK
jgi:hypothetical protein